MKSDATARTIDRWLRAVGATVEAIHGRRGLPDRLVGYQGRTFLLEYKSEHALKKDGTLSLRHKVTREGQAEWAAKWRGEKPVTVSTPEQALLAICAWTPARVAEFNAMAPEIQAARRSRRKG